MGVQNTARELLCRMKNVCGFKCIFLVPLEQLCDICFDCLAKERRSEIFLIVIKIVKNTMKSSCAVSPAATTGLKITF